MAPVIAALAGDPRFAPVVVNTGQHRELLAETMALFRIVPDVSLDLMQPGQRLAGFVGRCVEALDAALAGIAPAAIVAQGDTTTVLAAALCAFYQDMPFLHVEAGTAHGRLPQSVPRGNEPRDRLALRDAALRPHRGRAREPAR